MVVNKPSIPLQERPTEMTLFKDKYRIESARLPVWDYSSPGAYFVTICTKEMQRWFGDIIDGRMELSAIGEMVADEWKRTERIRPNVTLDEWIIMPNHLHGIVVINEMANVETHSSASLRRPHNKRNETHRDASLQEPRHNKFGPQRNNLASIIRGFKSASTKRVHAAGHSEFAWQPRFYDHIIRNENSLNKIRRYIADNLLQWDFDRNHPSGSFEWM